MGFLSRAVNSTANSSACSTADSTAFNKVPGREPDRVVSKINQYHSTYSNFNCIIFEAPDNTKDNINRKLAELIKYPGIVIPLSTNRPLILLPPGVDHELVAHRISKTLNMTYLLSFEGSNPGDALKRINSLQ